MRKRRTPKRDIPPERKTVYYIGMALGAIGFLLFFSVFLTGALSFGDFSNFDAKGRSMALRGISGMFLMIVGGILATIGAHGLAGSGVVLDPKQARKDIEPWSRMAGGVADDVLSEVGVVRKIEERLEGASPSSQGGLEQGEAPPAEIKIRCRACRALNDEAAKFCNQCGAEL